MAPCAEEDKIYLAALLSVPQLGGKRLLQLLRRFGSLAQIWQADGSIIRKTKILPPKAADSLQAMRASFAKETFQEKLETAGAKLITLWDEAYPVLLKETYNPPLLLYCQGHLPKTDRIVAFVGARKATPYGLNTAQTLAEQLGRSGVVIVSGGARGIDTKAHIGAMKGKGQTVVVTANGLDRCYSPENKRLFADILAQGGAVISEYTFGMEPLAQNFPARNRIIAGLSRGVAVIEADLRSGSLITADFALEEGRDVFAVPGSIYSQMSKGTNQLLRKGAIALTAGQDILAEYGWDSVRSETRSMQASLTSAEQALLEKIRPDESVTAEQLAAETSLPVPELMRLLLQLQMKNVVEEIAGSDYIRKETV